MTEIWQALSNEAALAAEHIAIGVTAIGKANYAQQAYYAQAFFALSVGFERTSKLILIVDHALTHSGTFPNTQVVTGFGHNLKELLQKVDEIAIRRKMPVQTARLPQSPIHNNIIEVLNTFATNVTRYYNVDFVTGKERAQLMDSPVSTWYKDVTLKIIEFHYSAKKRALDQENAQKIDAMLSTFALVSFHSETGQELNTGYDAALARTHTEFAAPYARLYLLQIARFFCKMMTELTYHSYTEKNEDIPHLSEFFALFNNEDKYLKGRKTWSIYRP